MAVLVTDASAVGPVVDARPVVWTSLQVLALATVLGLAVSAATVGGARDHAAPRRAVIVAIAAVFVGWTWWWHLLAVPAL